MRCCLPTQYAPEFISMRDVGGLFVHPRFRLACNVTSLRDYIVPSVSTPDVVIPFRDSSTPRVHSKSIIDLIILAAVADRLQVNHFLPGVVISRWI